MQQIECHIGQADNVRYQLLDSIRLLSGFCIHQE